MLFACKCGIGDLVSTRRRSPTGVGLASVWVSPACVRGWHCWAATWKSTAGLEKVQKWWRRYRRSREMVRGGNEMGNGEGAALPKVARILIADDHALVREGLRTMLSGEDGIEVIAEANDGQQALDICRDLKPDLVLMDVRMPVMDGLEATKRIKAEMPKTSVMMVTMHENPDYLFEAVKAGAAGYVLKDAGGGGLLGAVRRTLGGGSPLNPELSVQLLGRT